MLEITWVRRRPKGFFKNSFRKLQRVLPTQESIWNNMILKEMSILIKKYNKHYPNCNTFKDVYEITDPEDPKMCIETCKIIFEGTPKQELSEYEDSMKFFDNNSSYVKQKTFRDLTKKKLKEKLLNAPIRIAQKIYSVGLSEAEDKSPVQILNDIGIFYEVKWDKKNG